MKHREGADAILQFHPRTAILIRTWEGYKYTDDDLMNIRALITETSLLSGGEFQVFLLIKSETVSVVELEGNGAGNDFG